MLGALADFLFLLRVRTIVAAGKNGKLNLVEIVRWGRRCLGPADGASEIGVANRKLIIVNCKWFQPFCFDLFLSALAVSRWRMAYLDGEVNITGGIGRPLHHCRPITLGLPGFPVCANRVGIRLDVLLRFVVIEIHRPFY